MMRIEVTAPQDYIGALTGLLSQKEECNEEISENAEDIFVKSTNSSRETVRLTVNKKIFTTGRTISDINSLN